jgi:uncharacterized protein (DUF433 family)
MANPSRSRTAKIDTRSQPAYTLAEGARYLKLPQATLRAWVSGRPYPKGKGIAHSAALIHAAIAHPPTLSFWNLIEAHVLRALRIDHSVSLKAVRAALKFAEEQLGIERLLLRKELRTNAGKVFLDRYGELIDLSASGQLAMRQLLEAHLHRIEWDRWSFPVRLFPFLSADSSDDEPRVAIDPQIAFGRPILQRVGVSTATIADRIDAGETVKEVAEDYRLTSDEVNQAVLYERSA